MQREDARLEPHFWLCMHREGIRLKPILGWLCMQREDARLEPPILDWLCMQCEDARLEPHLRLVMYAP